MSSLRITNFTRRLYLNQLKYNRWCSSTTTNDYSGKASGVGNSTVNIPSTAIVTPLPDLSKPLVDLPPIQYATVKPEHNQTQVTTLLNGLKIASENRFGQFCTIGVVIDSGARYENTYKSGISHYLEKLAFHSTHSFSDKDEILKELEKYGGICDCQSTRDTFVYAASIDRNGLESVIKVLAEVVLRPRLPDNEIDLAKQAIRFELESLNMRPEQETILMDMIHAAAYKDNTLGFPKLCPIDNTNTINRNTLLSYLKDYHTPKRMVVAGVGVEHNDLVKYVDKYFTENQATWETEKLSIINSISSVDKSLAQYTGGVITEECEIPIYAAAGLPELAHIVLGLQGCSHQDKDFIASCVLNIMMGGGGSFSAGGPGKGMYTRLYTNVLNRYHWMYSATAYNNAYNDSGLFCIHASAPPSHVRSMVEVITKEMVTMATKPGEEELRRAKTQLQSMLLMNLEARPVVFEDIGRQVLATGMRKRPEYFITEIESIKAEDIQAVARRFLSSPPSLAARGDIKGLPSVKEIQLGLSSNDGRLPNSKRLSLFR